MPDYMVMGERGMADMGRDGDALARTTPRPMMTGQRPIRRRRDGRHVQRSQSAQRARKPGGLPETSGWCRPAPGTRAFEWTGAMPEPARFQAEGEGSVPLAQPPHHDTQVQVRKPMGTMNH